MEVCKQQGFGVSAWGPNQKTRIMIASGTFSSPSSISDQSIESLLRISTYDVSRPQGLLV